jgi:hypothetical protein
MKHRYRLVVFEEGDESGDRLTACNRRRLVIGCVSALVCGDAVMAAKDLTNSRLHLNAFEQGLGYFLLNALSSLLMIQHASSSSSASSTLSYLAAQTSPVLLPNTSFSIFSSWFRLHSSTSSRTTHRLSDSLWAAAKQCARLPFVSHQTLTHYTCTLPS